MSPTTHIAEQKLRNLRKRRSTPACYPCFKRKVKCRGGQPCEACTERGHPEICHIEELSKGSRRHPKGKLSQSPTTQDARVPSTVSSTSGNEPNVGELSAVSFVQNKLGTSEGRSDAFHVMGMRSSGFSIPLLGLGTNSHDSNTEAATRCEILQYYPAFRDLVMPLYPVVPDLLSLEMWIAELLRDNHPQMEPGQLAVILSCLALGAQFTEAHVNNRWELSQSFIARSSAYLQKANYIFEPSTKVVQSLLMIGIALQNLGLSNGSWNLLGLTYRCAQSLGLQHCTCINESGYQGALLWTAVTWQDALMSLRYDRTPMTTHEKEDGQLASPVYPFPPYYNVLNQLCRAGRKLLSQPTAWRHDPHNISSQVADLETLVATAPDHLHPQCTARTLQQKFQYRSFRVHSSLLIVEFCRPSFSITESENEDIYRPIRQKGMHYLFIVVDSFLELCTFSNVPLRLWSLTQAAVSCALVLALLATKQSCPKAEHLIRKLIDVFRTSDVSTPSSDLQSNETKPEIYGMHAKSANLLESILQRSDHIPAPDIPKESPEPTAVDDSADFEFGERGPFPDLAFDDFLNWPTELSLFDNTFPDSLLQANIDELPA